MEFLSGIKSRFSNSNRLDILPNQIRRESGGTRESLFTQITNLEEDIRKIKKDIISLNSLKSEQNKKSFLDIPEIERIIINWNTHNFNPNEKVEQKWKITTIKLIKIMEIYVQVLKNYLATYKQFIVD